MNWEECVRENIIEKRTKDKELAESLFRMALDRFRFLMSKRENKENLIFILEGAYDAILELCHSLLALNGFKTLSHECAIEFLRNRYLDNYETDFLQRLRKLRHGIKYYGRTLKTENIKANLERSSQIFEKIKNILEKIFSNG
jgi:uncharacterized protein (UPF0332 family)